MGEGRLERWSPLSGILFVALFISASAIFDDEPAPDASDGTILSYYADDGNQLKLELAFLLATFAAILFIWFVASLAGRLRTAEGDRAW